MYYFFKLLLWKVCEIRVILLVWFFNVWIIFGCLWFWLIVEYVDNIFIYLLFLGFLIYIFLVFEMIIGNGK